MAELADAPDLGSGGNPVQVQVLLPARFFDGPEQHEKLHARKGSSNLGSETDLYMSGFGPLFCGRAAPLNRTKKYMAFLCAT